GLGYDIRLTDSAKAYIAEKGFDRNFGARPLKRAIQKFLEDPIAEEILRGELDEGALLTVDFDMGKDEITFKGTKKAYKGAKPKDIAKSAEKDNKGEEK